MPLGAALGILGLVFWWWIYQTHHHKPALPQFLEMNSDIPDKTPPALLSYLLHNRTVSGPALIGTMLDLAQRGFVKLREERVEKKTIWGGMKNQSEYHWDLNRQHWGEHATGLLDYETKLLQFIFDDVAHLSNRQAERSLQ